MNRLRQAWIVLRKELRETSRDRRTLWTALVLAPIGAPVLFAVMMNLGIERGRSNADEPVQVAVAGASRAPELVAFLAGAGAQVLDLEPGAAVAPADVPAPPTPSPDPGEALARSAVQHHVARVALVIGRDFGARLREGRAAPVALIADSSDHKAEAARARVARWLAAYAGQIGAMRLQARGLDPALASALSIDEVDTATPAARALLMLGMLSYFILLATLVGGLHVAIDMTAGERERGSLESLLTLPVARSTLLAGKLAAACAFMVLALAITLAAFAVALPFVGLESLGMRANFTPSVVLRIFLVVLPFVPVGAALLTLVASFTRSYREAQTWLSFVLLVPTLPIVFASLYQIDLKPAYLLVPSLGQHLLITTLLRDEGLSARLWLLSAGASTVLAALLAWLALRLWRRESLLG